jgi:Acetyltransferase (GNAT) domain
MELCRSNEVFLKLGDPAFQEFWDRLYEACPWKTAFQSRLFVDTWYQHYQTEFEPVLLYSTDPGTPALLPLARNGNAVVVAGAHQAEYQAWLAREGEPGFLPEALRLLRERFEFDTLSFKYLPPGFPVRILPKEIADVQLIRRPLMRVNPADKLAASLKKKSNKSRLNGIRQGAELILEHITDARRLGEVLDEVILMYDFRQGAVNNSMPFEEDQQKKAFHLALARVPGLMHCSILRCGNQLFAALLGLCSRNTVHSGVFAHSPLSGKYSPGKLHLLLLGMKLQEEGFTFLDLTPGGYEWKDRFATEHDAVHRATIYGSRAARKRAALKQGAIDAAKRIAAVLNMPTEAAGKRWRRFSGLRVRGALKRIRSWFWMSAEVRIYRAEAAKVKREGSPSEASKNQLRDLLQAPPTKSGKTRAEFLSQALRRLEGGDHHVYAHVEKGEIVRSGWLLERREKEFLIEVQQDLLLVPHSALLFDFSGAANDSQQRNYNSLLARMAEDATRIPGTEWIYACVRGDDSEWRNAIENAGFSYQGSLSLTVRMGRSKKWTSVPAE